MELEASRLPLSNLLQSIPNRYRKKKEILHAYPMFMHWNPIFVPKKVKGKKAEGLRFEQQVLRVYEATIPHFVSALPFRYSISNQSVFCIPDGLILYKNELILVEVKLTHTPQAWFQLQNLYFPVVEKALGRKVRGVEVVKWFHPEVRFPEPVKVFRSLESFLITDERMGVVIWGL